VPAIDSETQTQIYLRLRTRTTRAAVRASAALGTTYGSCASLARRGDSAGGVGAIVRGRCAPLLDAVRCDDGVRSLATRRGDTGAVAGMIVTETR
jgi:hypothetical protein